MPVCVSGPRLHHEISYLARVKIIDTYYLSKLWYVLPYVKLSGCFISRVEEIITKFVWYPREGNKPVRNDFIKLQVSKGGLNLSDILYTQKSLTLMWHLRTKKFPLNC